MMVLAACCSSRRSSTALSPLVVVGACGTNSLSSSSFIVPIFWPITPIASTSYVWWLLIYTASISVSLVAFSVLSLMGATGLEVGVGVELLAGWVCEQVLRGILWLFIRFGRWMIFVG